MTSLIAVVAGSIGAAGRYWVSGAAQRPGGRFPLGTLVVNLTGSLAAGYFAGALAAGSVAAAALTGLTAGFTTFSTWSVESLGMIRSGQASRAALNLGGMLAAGIGLAALGYALAH